jgi:hypothetical protein
MSHKERRRLEIYAMNAILAQHEAAQARAGLIALQAGREGRPAAAATGGGDFKDRALSAPRTLAAGDGGPELATPVARMQGV